LREEIDPDVDGDSFFVPGSDVRKVYSDKPGPDYQTVLSKTQKRKLRKLERLSAARKGSLGDSTPSARSSSPSGHIRQRRYIVDSGASFHLVDPRTLNKIEKASIEEVAEPIPIETANGEVIVNQRCRVFVIELNIEVWAYLHEDTVCVLSLGLLVDRNGFTYLWKPGKAPTLKKGKFIVPCAPHFNVPFIYASTARGLPSIHTEDPKTAAKFEQIVKDEMKGAEDFIPPPPKPFGSEDVDSAGRESSLTPRRRSRG